MTQEQIAKLQELKRLYEAKILTKEEMLAEKAKILGTQCKDSIVDEKPVEESVPHRIGKEQTQDSEVNLASCESGDVTEKRERIVEPSIPQEVNTTSDGTGKRISIAVLCAVILFIGIALYLSKGTEEESLYETTEATTEVAEPVEEVVAYASVSNFWEGKFTLDGKCNKPCDTRAFILLKSVSENQCSGRIHIMAGEMVDDKKFDPFFGTFQGNVTGRMEDNSIIVYLEDFNTHIGERGNLFDKGSYQLQLFRITYSGDGFYASALGDMANFFDNGNINVTKGSI